MKYAIYHTATGEIVRTYEGVEVGLQLDNGESYISMEGGDDFTHYVDEGQVKEKVPPTLTVSPQNTAMKANGMDALTVDGIPTGSTVEINSEAGDTETTVEDGVASVVFLYPGDYSITIVPPFPQKTVTVTAHAD